MSISYMYCFLFFFHEEGGKIQRLLALDLNAETTTSTIHGMFDCYTLGTCLSTITLGFHLDQKPCSDCL